MNIDLAIPRGENVYEFNSLQDVVSSIKDDSIVNFDTNKDFADINKQNGYRVLLLKFTKDSKYFYPDIEGAYCPIFTYVSSRFKDTKGIVSIVYPDSFRDGRKLTNWDIDTLIDFSGFEVYLGDGFINVYLPSLITITNLFDEFYMIVVIDMMYDIRKNQVIKLLDIFS